MSIRAVLDASAIRAYAAGSIAVGELIGEFSEESAQFGLPVLCLINAAIEATPHTLSMLHLLTHHNDGQLLALDSDAWQRTATASTLYGTPDRACAALAVIDGDAEYVITTDPDAYPGVDTIAI